MKIQITIEWDSEQPNVTQVMAQIPEIYRENTNIIPIILTRAVEAILSSSPIEGETH